MFLRARPDVCIIMQLAEMGKWVFLFTNSRKWGGGTVAGKEGLQPFAILLILITRPRRSEAEDTIRTGQGSRVKGIGPAACQRQGSPSCSDCHTGMEVEVEKAQGSGWGNSANWSRERPRSFHGTHELVQRPWLSPRAPWEL